MKAHLLLFCAAALLLAGCAATKQTSEQRAAEQAAIAKSVREQVPAASFNIIATEMIPLRAPSKTLTDPYFVKVSDNYLESALPYFGRATNIPYGGGNALDFKTEITSYDWKEVKPGVFDIKIVASNSEDTYEYNIRLYDNGSASINVNSRNREAITFLGQLETNQSAK